jgi:hypothetical protein
MKTILKKGKSAIRILFLIVIMDFIFQYILVFFSAFSTTNFLEINDTSQYMLVSGALGHERFPRKQERGGTWNTSEFQI